MDMKSSCIARHTKTRRSETITAVQRQRLLSALKPACMYSSSPNRNQVNRSNLAHTGLDSGAPSPLGRAVHSAGTKTALRERGPDGASVDAAG